MEEKIKDVEISIQRQLESMLKSPSYNQCIYKVPEHIRKVKRDCYQPSVVSVGPFYYNNRTLKSSKELKLRHLQCFMDFSSYTNGKNAKTLGQYIDMIQGCEDEARSYYAEKISLSSNEFVEMVLVDATFIIFLFMWSCDQFLLGTHPMDNKFDVLLQVHQDLFLEENQLPFFILEDLYNEAFGAAYPKVSFKDVTCAFIGETFFPGREVARTIGRDKVRKVSNIKHLVDFLRICCLPTKLRHQLPKYEYNLDCDEFPSTAKELKAKEVKFVASESKNLLDITFSNGVLYIPTLTIQDTTEAVLRSVVFYEQCRHFHDSYVIDYLFFLDALVHTVEDVQILVQNGIITHWLGSNDDVASLLKQFTKQVTMRNPGFYYAQVSHDLNAFESTKRSKSNEWKTMLKKDGFNQPWSITVVLLLVLITLHVYTSFVM